MKLVFVNRFFFPDYSATSQILGDLAFHLAAESAPAQREVVVVTGRQRYDDPNDRLPAGERIRGVEVHRVRTTRFGRARLIGRALDYISFYASATAALWRICRRDDIVIAMTDPPLISVACALVAKLRGAKLVNWVQDAFPEVAQALGVRVPLPRVLRALRNWSLHTARLNIVLGERMAEWARAQGVSDERIAVISNWADAAGIRPVAPERNVLRAEWSLGGKFVVAYSGNLGRAHDYSTLLDAADRLRDRADIAFLFIGGGYHRAAVESDVAARGLRNVRFAGYQPRDRLGESLGAGDVHWISLLPALEGLIVPSKTYGILAAGRPALMVGDADGEIGSLLARHGCGFTIPIGRGAELADAVLFLSRDAAACQAMGARGRAAFDAHYSEACAFAAWASQLARLNHR